MVIAYRAKVPCALGNVGGIAGHACKRLYASVIQLLLEVFNGVRKLRKDKYLLVGVLLSQEFLQGVELAVFVGVQPP